MPRPLVYGKKSIQLIQCDAVLAFGGELVLGLVHILLYAGRSLGDGLQGACTGYAAAGASHALQQVTVVFAGLGQHEHPLAVV